MKLGLLTSSRADYGIYKSLLVELSKHKSIKYEFIAFGMHLSSDQGYTISSIRDENQVPIHIIGRAPTGDLN
jgi:GDP/UDP-N,N'-diacetylbacillosamine 2-epimerase (hydrolysing)